VIWVPIPVCLVKPLQSRSGPVHPPHSLILKKMSTTVVRTAQSASVTSQAATGTAQPPARAQAAAGTTQPSARARQSKDRMKLNTQRGQNGWEKEGSNPEHTLTVSPTRPPPSPVPSEKLAMLVSECAAQRISADVVRQMVLAGGRDSGIQEVQVDGVPHILMTPEHFTTFYLLLQRQHIQIDGQGKQRFEDGVQKLINQQRPLQQTLEEEVRTALANIAEITADIPAPGGRPRGSSGGGGGGSGPPGNGSGGGGGDGGGSGDGRGDQSDDRGGDDGGQGAERRAEENHALLLRDLKAEVDSVYTAMAEVKRNQAKVMHSLSFEDVRTTAMLYVHQKFSYTWWQVIACVGISVEANVIQNFVKHIEAEMRKNVAQATGKDQKVELIVSFAWAVHVYATQAGKVFFRDAAATGNIATLWIMLKGILVEQGWQSWVNLTDIIKLLRARKADTVVEYAFGVILEGQKRQGNAHTEWSETIRRTVFMSLTHLGTTDAHKNFLTLCRMFSGNDDASTDIFLQSPFYYMLEHRRDYIIAEQSAEHAVAPCIIGHEDFVRSRVDLQDIALPDPLAQYNELENFVCFLHSYKVAPTGTPFWNTLTEQPKNGKQEWKRTELQPNLAIIKAIKVSGWPDQLTALAKKPPVAPSLTKKKPKPPALVTLCAALEQKRQTRKGAVKSVVGRYFMDWAPRLLYGSTFFLSLLYRWVERDVDIGTGEDYLGRLRVPNTNYAVLHREYYGKVFDRSELTFVNTAVFYGVGVMVDLVIAFCTDCVGLAVGKLFAMRGGWFAKLAQQVGGMGIGKIATFLVVAYLNGTFIATLSKLFLCNALCNLRAPRLVSNVFGNFLTDRLHTAYFMFGGPARRGLKGGTVGKLLVHAGASLATNSIVKYLGIAAYVTPMTLLGFAAAAAGVYVIHTYMSDKQRVKARRIAAFAKARREDIIHLALDEVAAKQDRFTSIDVLEEMRSLVAEAIMYADRRDFGEVSDARRKFYGLLNATLNADGTPRA